MRWSCVVRFAAAAGHYGSAVGVVVLLGVQLDTGPPCHGLESAARLFARLPRPPAGALLPMARAPAISGLAHSLGLAGLGAGADQRRAAVVWGLLLSRTDRYLVHSGMVCGGRMDAGRLGMHALESTGDRILVLHDALAVQHGTLAERSFAGGSNTSQHVVAAMSGTTGNRAGTHDLSVGTSTGG